MSGAPAAAVKTSTSSGIFDTSDDFKEKSDTEHAEKAEGAARRK